MYWICILVPIGMVPPDQGCSFKKTTYQSVMRFGRGRDRPVIVTRRNELPLLMMLSLSGVNSRVTEKLESVTKVAYHWGNVSKRVEHFWPCWAGKSAPYAL